MAKLKTKSPINELIDSDDRSPILKAASVSVAVLPVAIALAATRLLPGSSARPTLIILLAAVLVSAWIGGRKPAWLALALSVFGLARMVAPALDPETLSGETHVAWLAGFFVTALILAEVICRMRRITSWRSTIGA